VIQSINLQTGRITAVGAIVCQFVIVFTALAAYPAPGAAQLRISEVLSAPTEDYDLDGEVDSKSDEFVEVHNPSAETVVLQNWYLRDGTGDAYHYGFAGSIPPGGTLVVTGTMSQVWQAENEAGTSGLSLNNTGDVVELWFDDPESTPVLLDTVTVPPHAAQAGRSLALDFVDDTYVLHDALAPYGGASFPGSTGCAPNPGIPGTCTGGVPTEARAWGALKADYGG